MQPQKPLRALIWCAVSSEEQAKDDKTSLETQERTARAFATENALLVVDLLIVGGFSRRFYNYPEFVEAAAADGFHDPARMLEHWHKRDFDVLIARDGSRIGREQGILGEFVARTVHGGARLYMINGGWIAKDNYREYIAMNGYSSSKEVDRLREGARDTKLKNSARGLTTNGRPPYSHRWVRNESGKLLRLELDESHRRLWDDLATVFLEGVSYAHIERVLYERFGHVDARTGQSFKRYFAYHQLHNPIFWGHSGYNYKNAGSTNGQKVGAWVYDPTFPAPEGVHIFRGVNTPVYTGEQAERVRNELRRRSLSIQGTARPYQTHRFTGLLLCGHCGHYMVHSGKGMVRCQSHRAARHEPKCDRFRYVGEKKVQAWLHAKLQEMAAAHAPDLLARGDEGHNLQVRIQSLRQEIDTLQAQARALVVKQTQAHSALTAIYDEQLETIGERLAILQRELVENEREERARDTSAAATAFRALPPDVGVLWTWPDTAINQALHSLMLNRRLVIMDGEIVGTADAPQRARSKERKRTHFGKNRTRPTE